MTMLLSLSSSKLAPYLKASIMKVARAVLVATCVVTVTLWARRRASVASESTFTSSDALLSDQSSLNLASAYLSEIRKFAAEEDNPRVLNVHVVPHTHDDVGWCKTVEQYYYGLNNSITTGGNVRSILTTVVQSLLDNPSHTFTYVESKFFSMWWNEQSDAVKDSVRYLVANEQLVFANGGWCMHDEASTHFVSMVDQTTLGHEFLQRELGVVPCIGWQLDPFGHSATQASLLTSRAGMDALYFGRIDYQDLNLRRLTQECEGLWNASTSLNDTTIFWGLTGSYYGNYGPPPGFWFDILTGEKPLVGAPQDFVMDKLNTFLEYLRIQSDQTKGNHIMLTMGSDFHFAEAHWNFANYDILVGSIMTYQAWDMLNIPSHLPNYDRISIFYSNPEYYTDCKYRETMKQQQQQTTSSDNNNNKDGDENKNKKEKIQWSIKTDDFFPYSSGPHSMWTGYFTSRTSFKRMERVSSGFLLAARQIHALFTTTTTSSSAITTTTTTTATEESLSSENDNDNNSVIGVIVLEDGDDAESSLSSSSSSPLYPLEDALGVSQHHDSVSGTAKQHVANDYSRRLHAGLEQAARYVSGKLRKVMLKDADELADLTYCPLLNETICAVSEEATRRNDTVLYAIVYNPVASERSTIVRLPVWSSNTAFRISRVVGENDGGDEDDSHDGRHDDPHQLAHSVEAPQQCTMCRHKKNVLMFDSGVIPPVGAVAFRITKVNDESEGERTNANHESSSSSFSTVARSLVSRSSGGSSSSNSAAIRLSNGLVTASFDDSTGMIKSISSNDVELDVTHAWGYYTSFDSAFDKSAVEDSGQNSGAYIFRPSTPEQELTLLTPAAGRAVMVNTSVGTEVHVSFNEPWLKQITRVLKGQPYVEVEYIVGPIPIDDGRGKEIVSRFSSSIQSDATFYTDSNAREFLQRRRNRRPSWSLSVYEPVAGNYYPVNAAIYIEDKKAALCLLVDRSQGGASLHDGSIEVMVQRRNLRDDGLGVDEPLNETSGGMTPYPPYGDRTRVGDGVIIRGIHRIMVGRGPVGASLCRSTMDGLFAAPLVLVGSSPVDKPVRFQNSSFSALQKALPSNLMLLTFKRLSHRNRPTFLVRLAHQYGVKDDKTFSDPVEVDLASLFRQYTVVKVVEKTLSGNQIWGEFLDKKKRWAGEPQTRAASRVLLDANNATVVLGPMDIRTFEVVVEVAAPLRATA